METSQTLSIESFSYSWLVNLKPSLGSLDSSHRTSLDASDEASFIEMDPRMPPSKRFFKNHSQDFKFDFPVLQSPLVDADQLFSNGHIMPHFVESLKIEPYESLDFNPSLASSSHAPKNVSPKGPTRCPSLKRCRTLSRRIFQKYLNFLRPLCRKLRVHNKSDSNHEVVVKRTQSVKNRGCYSESSPRISLAYSEDAWRKSCDSESSIYEAVLHCKRSIER
ncbi:PREDICTED: probable membrane-associated kinase regulator 6 [Lupinus angustifolius]|uniref:probable membrane-associated kinase regulator 6 n=1 Tax=Lupinus angustifolius TaxID=3871 RepID=UPI00092E55DA|nr:PREDICTED: probable membrane-associated kinase regulator 6 [Lupinus angustifolius]